MKAVSNFMTMVASAIGKFVMTVVQAARNSFKLCLETIIPFLIFVSTVFTLITRQEWEISLQMLYLALQHLLLDWWSWD